MSVERLPIDNILARNVAFSPSLFLLVSLVDSLKPLRRKTKSCVSYEMVSVESAVSQSSFVRSMFSLGVHSCVTHFCSLSIKGIFEALEPSSPYTTRACFLPVECLAGHVPCLSSPGQDAPLYITFGYSP